MWFTEVLFTVSSADNCVNSPFFLFQSFSSPDPSVEMYSFIKAAELNLTGSPARILLQNLNHCFYHPCLQRRLWTYPPFLRPETDLTVGSAWTTNPFEHQNNTYLHNMMYNATRSMLRCGVNLYAQEGIYASCFRHWWKIYGKRVNVNILIWKSCHLVWHPSIFCTRLSPAGPLEGWGCMQLLQIILEDPFLRT